VGELDRQLVDVGQGLAVLILTRNHALLFDSGPLSRSGWDAGDKVVVPYLRHLGVHQLDVLVSSHGDSDHAGGAASVLAWSGEATRYHSSADLNGAKAGRQGDFWYWDEVRFEYLHPGPFLPYLGNDSSCVLLVSTHDSQLLLPGDISTVVEQSLVRQYADLRLDLLVVPHHGSKTSSSHRLLNQFRPQVALVSSAFRNRFGMPHQEVVGRYRLQGTEFLNTADCGLLKAESVRDRSVVVSAAQRALDADIWHSENRCDWRRRVTQKSVSFPALNTLE
jgi:competence protein ComEC